MGRGWRKRPRLAFLLRLQFYQCSQKSSPRAGREANN